MGLLDDPVGFFFGSDGDQGVVDTRAGRTEEGKRFWQRWEEIYGEGGPADPLKIYDLVQSELTAPSVNISLDGVSIPALPRAHLNRAAALMGMVQPWLEGGYLLEQGRKGMGYYQQPTNGLIGNALETFTNSLASTAGRGVAGGLGGIFTGQPSYQPNNQSNNLGQYTRINYWGQ